MLKRACRFAALYGTALMILGCLPQLPQPDVTQPYGLLILPETIRLVRLNNQPLDTPVRVSTLRLPPGLHTLRFTYAGSSPQHAGQTNDPFQFQVQAGHQYVFEAKT